MVDFGTKKDYSIMDGGRIILNTVAIDYVETGYKTLTFSVIYKDGTIQTTKGKFHVELPEKVSNLTNSVGVENNTWISKRSFKGYDESAAIFGQIEYRIFFRDGATRQKLQKPILIIDGFDPGDKRKFQDKDSKEPADDHSSIEDIMNYYVGDDPTNLISKLQEEGYDVILINHPTYKRNGTTIDGGADYIERNAMNLVSFLEEVNRRLKINSSNEKLVVVGPSMGGLISRYALAYMEENGIQHNTRIWVSVDSPHLGANIPLGLQSLINQLSGSSEKAREFLYERLRSPAAKQQLIEQYVHDPSRSGPNLNYVDGKVMKQGFAQTKGAPFYRTFYKSLFENGLEGSKGYPKGLRKISIVNGSLTGSKKYGNPFITENAFVQDTYANDGEQSVNIRGFQQAYPLLSGSSIHIASLESYFMPAKNKRSKLSRFKKHVVTDRSIYYTNQNSRGNMDNIPGGWFPAQRDFVNPVMDTRTVPNPDWSGSFFDAYISSITIGLSVIFGGSWWEQRTLKHSHSFIPSFSAIAHKKPDQNWSKPLNYNLVCKNETPFDTYFGYEENTQHTSFTEESVDWLLAELDGSKQEPYFPVKPNSLTSDTFLCGNINKTYSFKSCDVPGNVVKWVTSSNLNKLNSSNNSITVKAPVNGGAPGSIKAIFKNGVAVTKNFWIGNTRYTTRVFGSCYEPRYELRPDPLDKVFEWKITHNGRTTYRAGSFIILETYEFNLVNGEAASLRVSARNNCGWSNPRTVFIRKPTLCDCGYNNPNCGGSDGPPTPLITTENGLQTVSIYIQILQVRLSV